MEKGVVFVVDDDPAVCRSISTMVQVMGLHAETFDCAERFLEAVPLQRHGCLITDVRMLGMSGMQLLERMADRGWTLPTIVVTAYADVRVAVSALRAGAATLLEKPYRDQELWDSIIEAMAASEKRRSRLARTCSGSRVMWSLLPSFTSRLVVDHWKLLLNLMP